jgi:hypothetical protein
MFEHIGSYPEIKIAIWWDGCDWDANGNVARPYFIDEPRELLQIFRRAESEAAVLGCDGVSENQKK